MGDQGHFQGSQYNTPHESRQRLSSNSSIGSHQSFHGEESPQYYHMQPVTPEMPLQNEMNSLQLSRSQQSLAESDSSFDCTAAFDNMPDFEYNEPPMAPLIGDPNAMWHQQNDPNLQMNYYPANYVANQPQMMMQMNQDPNYQNQGYDDDYDERFESTLTHANANNAQAATTQPQQAPMMAYSNPASQEPQFVYYHQAPPSNMSADGYDYSSQGEGYDSDTSQRSMRRGRTSRPAHQPYDQPASRSTSRNSNHSQSNTVEVASQIQRAGMPTLYNTSYSSNHGESSAILTQSSATLTQRSTEVQAKPAGRGRPALYNIDFNNLTELQMKAKKKIEKSDKYRNKATEEEKHDYLVERLQNNEAVRISRLNKNIILRDVLDFGEQLYYTAQHVQLLKVPGVENEIESLLEKIERWEVANNTNFVQKVRELKPKPNADNEP